MTTTYNPDLANDLDRLTAFVAGLSCCCQPLMRCSRCQALYGGMRREVTNGAAVLGIIGPPEMDPDEAAANTMLGEIARLKHVLAELKGKQIVAPWSGLKLGDVCRARCGAPARYLENGKVAFVCAMDNDRGIDDYGGPANGQERVLVGDFELLGLLKRLHDEIDRNIIKPYQPA